MPDRVVPFDSGSHSDHTVQKLLLGTHTSNDEQNYLQIVSVKIPLESSKDTRDFKENVLDDNTNGIGGSNIAGSKSKAMGAVSLNMNGMNTAANGKGEIDEKNEQGEKAKKARISIDVQINH